MSENHRNLTAPTEIKWHYSRFFAVLLVNTNFAKNIQQSFYCICMLKIAVCLLFVPVLKLKPCMNVFHSARGMMVNGRMGLLASSSKAVRKHSVAAAALP